MRILRLLLFLPAFLSLVAFAGAQENRPEPRHVTANVTPSSTSPSGLPGSEKATVSPDRGPTPTWETQTRARTYILGVPAPRGQIVDRHGNPLAQTRVSHNLAISFPMAPALSDREVLAFAEGQLPKAQRILGRQVTLTPAAVLKHYQNRPMFPYVIAQDLSPQQLAAFEQTRPEALTLQPLYQRFYPNGPLAGHIVGYAGRAGRIPDGPLENNELLWPNAEGRDGLEHSFDNQLQGKVGQYHLSLDATGKKAAAQVVVPPQPGYNVVTALDQSIQRLCEESLARTTKRGALVIVDPNNGDILAMASWPTFNPSAFVPIISDAEFKALQEDPNIPLLPRAFRSAYPPGSAFKVFVGLAALQSGRIKPDTEFSCPPAFEIGNLTFRNWKREHAGTLNFADALTQSCNTWFYQVGLKIGGRLISDYSLQLGLGMRTGIPLNGEAEGRIPTDEYMMKVYNRRLAHGDVANLSIGQGDTLISPLQMAMAMSALGNGGTVYVPRLVLQVQGIDNQIVTAYDVRARAQVDIDKPVMNELRDGMVGVVSSRAGTASRAAVPGVRVAGKTGTAQWGPKNRERTAAWFAGFAPAENPRYAFAALYEGDAKDDDVHGGTNAAPMIGLVLKELLKDEAKKKSKTRKKTPPREEPGEDDDPGARPPRARERGPFE
ncbi:MAG: penicillin-binding protein 2 [Verrucomicrobiota bacterium]|nr:penicillin-binding protein 2 [Verrucomicrobiota bacterium]